MIIYNLYDAFSFKNHITNKTTKSFLYVGSLTQVKLDIIPVAMLTLDDFLIPLVLPNIIDLHSLIKKVFNDERKFFTPAYDFRWSYQEIYQNYIDNRYFYAICFDFCNRRKCSIQIQAKGTDFVCNQKIHMIEQAYDIEYYKEKGIIHKNCQVYVLEDKTEEFFRYQRMLVIVLECGNDSYLVNIYFNNLDVFYPSTIQLMMSKSEYTKFINLLNGIKHEKELTIVNEENHYQFLRYKHLSESNDYTLICKELNLHIRYQKLINITNTIEYNIENEGDDNYEES